MRNRPRCAGQHGFKGIKGGLVGHDCLALNGRLGLGEGGRVNGSNIQKIVSQLGLIRYTSFMTDLGYAIDAAGAADVASGAPKTSLDSDTERAARAFLIRIAGRYAIDRAILFGSRARRTHSAESDADIAIILKGEQGKRSAVAIDMADVAFDVMLETGILIEALPLWSDELAHPEHFSNPALIRTIQREGIIL
jgi:predicted nucleotidyltransferase